jgi:hypothetical protein
MAGCEIRKAQTTSRQTQNTNLDLYLTLQAVSEYDAFAASIMMFLSLYFITNWVKVSRQGKW